MNDRNYHNYKKKQKTKTALALALALSMTAGTSVSVFAASPEFAHDAATWARLRDNVMEYDEIDLLVEEYNPTYLNNQATFLNSRSDADADDLRNLQYDQADMAQENADSLRDSAESMKLLMQNPQLAGLLGLDPKQLPSTYAMMIQGANMMEQTALKSEQGADASYQDSEMKELTYRLNQRAVVTQTKALFAAYHQVENAVALLDKNVEIAASGRETVKRQAELGMATQMDVLNAEKAYQTLVSTRTETKANLENTRQNLCMMTGWRYSDTPEIRKMPQADESPIALMNPDQDMATALAQNLSLKVNEKAYKNMADGSTDKKNMERTIKNQKESIASGIKTMYNDVLMKQISYHLAQTSVDTAEKDYRTAGVKADLGMISAKELKNVEVAAIAARNERDSANAALIQSIEAYQWAVKGYLQTQ